MVFFLSTCNHSLYVVLPEVLRKYPFTIILDRKCDNTYTFEDTGLTIDKNVSILIPIAGLHYDPQYFLDPEKFDPERFSLENRDKIVPYTFLPFGDGPRSCLGMYQKSEVKKNIFMCYICGCRTKVCTFGKQSSFGSLFEGFCFWYSRYHEGTAWVG